MFSIQKRSVKFCLDTISDKVLRISVLPVEESVKAVFSTIDLTDKHEWNESPVSTVSAGQYAIGGFTVVISDMTAEILKDGKTVQKLSIDEEGKIAFPLGKSHIFGMGHGYQKHLDRRGENYDLRVNGQVLEIIQNGSATSPTPYVIGSEGWALFFHQPWKANIDLRGEEGVFSVPALYPAEYADIFVVACDTPADAAKEYYAFTGLPPMPPKYAFGYQQSYRTLEHNGVNEVMRTAKYMRENDLPCDVLIYLGTGYCDNGWNTWNGNFDFHPVAFPTPKETMQELHDLNYKIDLHVTKCYTGLHGTVNDENVSPLEYDHAKNYWKVHEKLYEIAKNEVWWPDDADEVDMEQRLTRHRMYYEGSLKLNPDIRPFQMQRNAFPGHTKWGGIIWSGDIMSEWETLKNQVPIGLNASLSCSPYWGTDTGGFFSTCEYTGELFIRWFEYSAFTPFFRGHGRPSYLHNPWGWKVHRSWDDIPLEAAPAMPRDNPPPKEALPDERVEPICRKYLHLRYALLPYLYTLSREVYDSGMPMMRPLWFDYPDDETAVALGSEYLLGPSLLVAPVTAKGAETWKVYLPKGVWYDFWTNERYEGGKWIEVSAPLDTIPLFVKAGSILPIGPITQYVSTEPKKDFEELTLKVYGGADGAYELYEDDGISMGYQRGESTITRLTWNDSQNKLLAEGHSTQFAGHCRNVRVEVIGDKNEYCVQIQY